MQTFDWSLESNALATSQAPQAFGLPRVLRSFSFEERSDLPWDMPPGFVRIVRSGNSADASPPPYTTFGDIGYDDQVAHTGQWSLRLELDGGSMAAALLPGEALAIPGCTYAISANVRTLGLHHARARLIAHYVDQSGQPLDGGEESQTEPIETAGEWQPIELTLAAAPPQAASIITELQVLQPDRFRNPALPFEPVFEDVAGSVWFDDLTIQHRPTITLGTCGHADAGDHKADAPVALHIDIFDPVAEPALLRITIASSAGQLVREELIERPHERPAGHMRERIAVGDLPVGWYHATASLQSLEGKPLATAMISFAMLPHDQATGLAAEDPAALPR